MSHTPPKPNYVRMILKQLAHPMKLRLSLCVAIIATWFFLFFTPLSERMAATTTRIGSERKRITIGARSSSSRRRRFR